MNIARNKIFIILIIYLFSIGKIYTEELVITIPKEFNTFDYPLPPFPIQAINKLSVKDYTNLLETPYIRDESPSQISYVYYNELLRTDLFNKFKINQTYLLSINIDDYKIGYGVEYLSNPYYLDINIDYTIIDPLFNAKGHYVDYRLPITLGADFSTEDKFFSIYGKNSNFNQNWSLDYTFLEGDSIVNLQYEKKYGLYSYTDLSYSLNNNFYGSLGVGNKNIILGLSLIGINPMLYIDLNYNLDKLQLLFNTNIISKKFNYKPSINFNFNRELSIGSGISINVNKSYNLLLDYIWLNCSFIKDDLTSIISLNIYKPNMYDLNFELSIKDLAIGSYIRYTLDHTDDSLEVYIKYKVGNK
ncbi:hypothetical protein EW093_00640 [Thiospirochaeta perfilievii]|uniref:Uncharacterized protein n=1 Tax=Thiospirochaeta perfilievii TaxID=252967 RepID=A0A5C1QAU0_9SPIO|nr:hypothetical protein [Thiospirochaeta perfilievii]QEN03272.1 hypothetical protein EW093_00640 [Thiospirochaeta perfilievii]